MASCFLFLSPSGHASKRKRETERDGGRKVWTGGIMGAESIFVLCIWENKKEQEELERS